MAIAKKAFFVVLLTVTNNRPIIGKLIIGKLADNRPIPIIVFGCSTLLAWRKSR